MNDKIEPVTVEPGKVLADRMEELHLEIQRHREALGEPPDSGFVRDLYDCLLEAEYQCMVANELIEDRLNPEPETVQDEHDRLEARRADYELERDKSKGNEMSETIERTAEDRRRFSENLANIELTIHRENLKQLREHRALMTSQVENIDSNIAEMQRRITELEAEL